MEIRTRTRFNDPSLAHYGHETDKEARQLVISGFWSESPMHGGHAAYYVEQTQPDTWVLHLVERNAILDDVTEADIEVGGLNDDQLQALHGRTLEQAQGAVSEEIVAVLLDAPADLTSLEAAERLYKAVLKSDGKAVWEIDDEGLLME